MKGEHMSNHNTRSSIKSTKSISFRITPNEWEAIKVLSTLDGSNGITATAREEILKAMYERVPQEILSRLGL